MFKKINFMNSIKLISFSAFYRLSYKEKYNPIN